MRKIRDYDSFVYCRLSRDTIKWRRKKEKYSCRLVTGHAEQTGRRRFRGMEVFLTTEQQSGWV